MKTSRILLIACFAIQTLVAFGQDVFDEGFTIGRPETYNEESVHEDGLYRAPRRIGSQTTAPLRSMGVQHVPVVLVAFPDQAFTVKPDSASVKEYYRLFCNGTKNGQLYTGHGSHGSIYDYFVEQSDSMFQPEFTVIGPVTLDSCFAYYGENSYDDKGNLKVKDIHFSQFRSDALTKAVQIHTDWDVFDNDKNGDIDMVFFVFAGVGENIAGVDSNRIWPKETTSSTKIGNYTFACSAVTSETRPSKWNENRTEILETKGDGVGVFIHELSHALGLPDFYDTNYKAFGMDLWSIMDTGEYGNNGYNPSNYTAYEREFMGWEPLPELTEPCILTIPCFSDGGTGYRIRNEANPDKEYYIIENRQARGWDDFVGLKGHGLQVTHVDYDESKWKKNNLNTDPLHQRMTIIAANNCYDGTNNPQGSSKVWLATLKGNLYPGDTQNYELTDESTPAAEVFTGMLMHKPLRNITENEDGTVTVCFRTFGRLDAPEAYEAENIEMNEFDASWSEVDHATRYAYEIYRDTIVIQCDTIAETQLHVEGLQPSSALKYRVRALADTPEDSLDSEWSDFSYLSTLADFIRDVSDSDKRVDVYTAGGILVSHCHADELSRLSLHRGIYIVRYANGSARKAYIR